VFLEKKITKITKTWKKKNFTFRQRSNINNNASPQNPNQNLPSNSSSLNNLNLSYVPIVNVPLLVQNPKSFQDEEFLTNQHYQTHINGERK
jgi:hypothetical protein